MKGIYKYIIYLFITLFISTAESLTCSADNTSTYNNWKIHQSYHFPTRTEKSGNKIYVLANGGLFSYDKSDDNITIYSKKSPLNDAIISFISYSPAHKLLIVVYDNSNIDLLADEYKVYNIPDFKNKVNTSDKHINQCFIFNNKAFLSTGNGILSLDLQNRIIDNFYALGKNILACCVENNCLYACSEKEIIFCPLKENMLDPNNWKTDNENTVTNFLSHYGDKPMKENISEYYLPNSPIRNYAFNLSIKNNHLLVAGGAYLEDRFLREGTIMLFKDEKWINFQEEGISQITGTWYKDIICVVENPNDNNIHFAASCGEGLYEFREGKFIKQYSLHNSPLQSALPNDSDARNYVRVGGLIFDKEGNLWMTNCETNAPIHVLQKDGKWKSFYYKSLKQASNLGRLLIDKRGWLWGTSLLESSYGLFCLNYNQTIQDEFDDKFVYHTKFNEPSGQTLDSRALFCLTEDKEGYIWMGTSKGILLIENPENVFLNNFSIRQFKIFQNEKFLENESVTCICIDGENQKWIGTDNNGLFLLSSDNKQVISHFTIENSLLLSNSIQSLAYNENTGELWIGTSKGIVSYMTGIVSGSKEINDENILIYPNPVKPSYEGNLTISQLEGRSRVKIINVAGKVMCEGSSLSGTFTWNLRDYNNKKVPSGIYIIFITDENGKRKASGKVTVIR